MSILITLVYTLASADNYIDKCRQLYDNAEYSKAQEYVEKGLLECDTSNRYNDYMYLTLIQTNIKLEDKTNYLDCYKTYNRLKAYFKKNNDLPAIADINMHLGHILQYLYEYTSALEYYNKAIKQYTKAKKNDLAIKVHLYVANSYYLKGDKVKARQIQQYIIKQPVFRNDTVFRIRTMLSISGSTDSIPLKERYAPEAYRLASEINNPELKARCLINMGAMLGHKGNIRKALECYEKSFAYSSKLHIYELMLPSLNSISYGYSLLNEMDSAYRYISCYNHLRDSLEKTKHLSEINRLETKMLISHYEQQLVQASERLKTERIIFTLTTIVILSILSFACYVFISARKKSKIKRLIKAAENRELQTKLQNESLRNEKIRLELNLRDRELMTSVLASTERIKTLEEIQERLLNEKENGNISYKAYNELSQIVSMQIDDSAGWEFFRTHFEKIEPKFFKHLKEKYPSLTEHELRLCACIKTKMQTKKIAKMLSVTPDAIKKARYRMRKKLNLPADMSIEDMLFRI